MWDVNLKTLAVGDEVMARKPIYEQADEFAPGGYLCQAFEKLIVRDIRSGNLPIAVSHPHVTDRSFGVTADEIALYDGPDAIIKHGGQP